MKLLLCFRGLHFSPHLLSPDECRGFTLISHHLATLPVGCFDFSLLLLPLGNKGAVGVSFMFNGTSLGFVNSHLTSGSEKKLR